MLQTLRRAMIRPEHDRLGGIGEVDETSPGAWRRGSGGRRRDSSKSIVVAAVEGRGRGTGRIRLGVVPDVSGSSLVGFVEAVVAPGSIVRTDGWQGYVPLKQRGYDHRPTTQGAPKEAAALFPRVHRVFTHLKTWLWGTHRGVSRKHLPHSLNEFVFRFTRRRTPMAAFQSLLGLTGQHRPTTYHALYRAE